MPARKHAELLLRKAAQDEFTLDKLISDPDAPDEVIGFHAQQAVEKMLKAVLALRSVRYRRTHDLVELIDALRDNGIVFPNELEEVRLLGPFATEYRYDDLPCDGAPPVDREWIRECIRRTRSWAEKEMAESVGSE